MARSTPAQARTSRQTARIGLAAAIVVATGAVCTIAYFYATSVTQLPPDNQADVIDTAPIQIGEAGTANSGEFQILLVDEHDATKVTGKLSARSIQSENRTLYRVKGPDAEYYLDDGSVLHITADDGLVTMPSPEQQPEQGELSGHVRVRYYAPDEFGHRVSTKSNTPDIEVTTDAPVRFDKQRGEVSTTGTFTVVSERVTGSGIGLSVALNQIEKRVSRIVIEREGNFRVPLARSEPKTEPATVASAPPTAPQTHQATPRPNPISPDTQQQPETAGPAVSDDVITAYRVTCLDDVVIELYSGDRAAAVKSERLDAWFRLVNNALAEDAIRPIAFDLASRREVAPIIQPIGPEPIQTPLGSVESSSYLTNSYALTNVVPAQPADVQPESSINLQEETTGALQIVTEPSVAPLSDIIVEADDEDRVTLAWSGRMIVVPTSLDETQLFNDDAALLLSSPQSGVVTTNDLHSDSGGISGNIEYFATRRRLVLHEAATPENENAPGTTPFAGISLDMPGFGTINAVQAVVDLSTQTAQVTGPANLLFTQDGEQIGNARFDDECLADLLVDGDTVYGIRAFTMKERAELNHTQGAFRGDTIEGQFTRSNDGVWTIEDIASLGNAIAVDHEEGWLEADTIAVHFDTSVATKSNVVVRTLKAEGNVLGEQVQDDVALAARSLEAQFEPGRSHRSPSLDNISATKPEEKLRSVLVRADLFGNEDSPATYDQVSRASDPVHASAQHIRFDAIARRATLVSETGEPALAQAGASSIVGPQVLLDSVQRSVWVFGPGSFSGQAESTSENGSSTIDASWATEMRYDDRAGRLLAVGNVTAQLLDDTGLSLDELQGHRLEAQITPFTEPKDNNNSFNPSQVASVQETLGSRQLQWAEVEGAVLHIDDDARATATSKRYELVMVPSGDDPQAPMTQEKRLVRLGYLEADSFRVDTDLPSNAISNSTEINAQPETSDKPTQRLTVPGAGKMLMMARASLATEYDERESETPTPSAPLPDVPEFGQSLFTWTKSMSLHQADARAELRGDVTMTHIREIDGQQTYIEAQYISASMNNDASSESEGSIRTALATEGVYVRSRGNDGTREARADIAEYDATKGHVVLKASPGRTVTLYDPSRSGAVEAAEIFWDLVKDRIEIRNASPFVGAGGP
ncbi:MAG: hypothetical protein H6815_12070 [Phycisphaeraceae bacterium]|nr:hypothetical protein [Phycisphaerales bacterium]MCB9861176.1 hypothetical protein [Phycisphaeraceae bacterium]